MTTDSSTKELIKINTTVVPPQDFNVIYVNDEVTTVEFVIESLVIIFNHTKQRANDLTAEIHDKGSAVVATLPFEIAEQKGIEVTLSARSLNYPLQIKLEPETVV